MNINICINYKITKQYWAWLKVREQYLLKNFFREDPSHILHFEETVDKLHTMLSADLANQVDAEPVVVALTTQCHHSGQKVFDCGLAFTLGSLCAKH